MVGGQIKVLVGAGIEFQGMGTEHMAGLVEAAADERVCWVIINHG